MRWKRVPAAQRRRLGFSGFRRVPSEGIPKLILCSDAELAQASRQERRALRRNNGGGESARSMRRRLKKYRRAGSLAPVVSPQGVKYINAWTSRSDRADALLHAVPYGFTPAKSFHAMCGAKVQHYERVAFDPTEPHTCSKCRTEVTGGLLVPVR